MVPAKALPLKTSLKEFIFLLFLCTKAARQVTYLWKIIPKSIIVLVMHRVWALWECVKQVKRKDGNYFSEVTLEQYCCSLVWRKFIKPLNKCFPFMPRMFVHVVLHRVLVGLGVENKDICPLPFFFDLMTTVSSTGFYKLWAVFQVST